MIRNCQVCGSTSKKLLFHQNFNNNVIAPMKEYDVVSCNECGFIYAENLPSQEEFNKYYAQSSQYEFKHSDGKVSKPYLDHANKLIDFIDKCSDYYKYSKILEIGCSTGFLLSLLKKKGYSKLMGIDPSKTCVETVKNLYSIDAQQATISSFETEEKFNLIILSAVLEHIVDLKESIIKISSLLKDNGFLFIEVPDASRFYQHIYTPYQQFSIEHINFFTDTSLMTLFTHKFNYEYIYKKYDTNEVNQTIDPNILFIVRKVKNANNYYINRYIELCAEKDNFYKNKINEILNTREKVIVWGVGTHTQRLLDDMDISKIAYFVDSNQNYENKGLKGIVIKSPKNIKENIPIVIMSHSYQNEIIQQIKNLKLDNEIIKLYE